MRRRREGHDRARQEPVPNVGAGLCLLHSITSKAMRSRQPILFTYLDLTLTPIKMGIKKNARDSRIPRLLQTFDRLHRQHVGGQPAALVPAKDATLIKAMLSTRDESTLVELMELFFEISDKWVRARGFSIGMFQHCLPGLLVTWSQRPRPLHPLLSAIQARLSRHDYDASFREASVHRDGVTTIIVVASADDARWILKHHSQEVWDAAAALGVLPVSVTATKD